MKKHNLLKVICLVILGLTLLTWILPTAYYQYSLVEQERIQMGLFDLFKYPTITISYFSYILVYALVIGGFYAVVNKTEVYRSILDKIVKLFKGKEWIALTVIMFVIAALTSVCGLSFGLLIVFPFIVSLVLLMGYNKLVAASVTVGSVAVGLAGTTFAASTIGTLNSALSLNMNSSILMKIIIFVVALGLLIFNTLMYAKKIKVKATDIEDELIPEKKVTKKAAWPLVVIMDILLLVIILSFVPWYDTFKLSFFETLNSNIATFKVFGFEIFGNILGTVSAFGAWDITALAIVTFIATIVIAIVYNVKLNDLIDTIKKGAKKALIPGLLMLLIYTVLVIVTYHPYQLVIYKWLLQLTSGFNVFTSGVIAFLASALNIEMYYASSSVIPYMITLITDKSLYPLIAIIFQSMYGVVALAAPTSVVLIGTLAYLNIPYQDWLKHIWKLLVELVAILFIIFTIILFL